MSSDKTTNAILFTLPMLIWGSTWYAIKFQLGVVDPLLSVCYRFILAGVLLFVVCLVLRYPMRYKPVEHFLFGLQGICLFGFNYWFVYMAENWITSGLIAVVFSLILFTNVFFSAVFLKVRITKNILIGAILGVAGTFFIFKDEFFSNSGGENFGKALLYCFISLIFASLGNVVSAYNQKRKLPVVQTNAFGMLYGALVLLVVAIFAGKQFVFDLRPSYLISIGYLAVFGSIVAFTAYLKLLGKIGPSKSAYVVVFIPILAMIISTFFESYEWQQSSLLGMPVLILGNVIAMTKPEKFKSLSWKLS